MFQRRFAKENGSCSPESMVECYKINRMIRALSDWSMVWSLFTGWKGVGVIKRRAEILHPELFRCIQEYHVVNSLTTRIQYTEVSEHALTP